MGALLRVTAKGQVTLRREVLEHLGVAAGDRLAVEMLPDGRVEVRAAKGAIGDFIGSLEQPGTPPLSVDEIGRIAAEGWTDKR
ncbi:MAG: AbrB/MazE/SpoVT family DNA-binding domain-containing protein [Azospirillum sp.]|nr:AbrB/MazE/SpoVT family DNA-binding domain-containing protein [Azospirillum sp.]